MAAVPACRCERMGGPHDPEGGLVIAARDRPSQPRNVHPERAPLRRVAAGDERSARRVGRGWRIGGFVCPLLSIRTSVGASRFRRSVGDWEVVSRALDAHRLLDGDGAAG
jgi:hypothetical protein